MRGIIVLSLVLLFNSLSCDQGTVIDEQFPIQSIEWKLGNNFVYSWSVVEVDSAGREQPLISDTVKVQVVEIGETIGAYTGLVKFEGFSLNRNRGSAFVWYQIRNNEFVEVAYRTVGAVPIVFPKRGNSNNVDVGQFSGSFPFTLPNIVQQRLKVKEITADSVLMRDEPRIVYQYPLNTGKFWVSFNRPFLQTREVVGAENVQTSLGILRCTKIQTRIPTSAPTIEWFDRIDNKGLVLRTLSAALPVSGPDLIVTDTIRMREKLELLQRNF